MASYAARILSLLLLFALAAACAAQIVSVKTATRSVAGATRAVYHGGHAHAGHEGGHSHGHSHGHSGHGHAHAHEEEHLHDMEEHGHADHASAHGGHSHGGHSHADHSHGDHSHGGRGGDHTHGAAAGKVADKEEPTSETFQGIPQTATNTPPIPAASFASYIPSFLPPTLVAMLAQLLIPHISTSMLSPVLDALPPAAMAAALCFAGGSVVGEVFLHGVGERMHGHGHDHGGHGHHEGGGLPYEQAVLVGILAFFALGRLLDALLSGAEGGSKEKAEPAVPAEESTDEKEAPKEDTRRRTRASAQAEHDHQSEHDHDHAHDHAHDSAHFHGPHASKRPSPALALHHLSALSHSLLDSLALSVPFFLHPSPPWPALAAVLLHEVPHRAAALLVGKALGGDARQLGLWGGTGVLLGWGCGWLLSAAGAGMGDREAWEGVAAGAMLYVGMVGVLGEVAGHSHGHGEDHHGHGHGGGGNKFGRALVEIIGLAAGMASAGLVKHEH
ncbi:ZIP zinc transporter-domain-containing protein [Hyaloraphidium curvatum]|nr:ZIP zinc transporter-domain-containing protein [Hyaloraphidium curvatum]